MTNSGYISPKLPRKSKDNYKSNLTENYCFYTNNEVLLFPNINNMQQRKQAYLRNETSSYLLQCQASESQTSPRQMTEKSKKKEKKENPESKNLLLPQNHHNSFTDQKLWQVIEQSNLKPFLTDKKEGLDFQVQENGENVSVGQRQLLCLARALLKNSKIFCMSTDIKEEALSLGWKNILILKKNSRKSFLKEVKMILDLN